MGENCCGGHAKRRGFGIYTDNYYIKTEQAKMRQEAMHRLYSNSLEDYTLIKEELNEMNRAGNEVISNNHKLRAEIYELKSDIGRLSEIVRLVSEAKNMDEVQSALHFPYKAKFNPLP
jgi:predicted nuclease with TOPRIM domain